MNVILFDGPNRNSLLPLTFTRPVADLRVGILTIREKWEKLLGTTTTTLTEPYLEEKYPMVEMENNIMIDASYLPTEELIEKILQLSHNQVLFYEEDMIAFHTTDTQEDIDFNNYEKLQLSHRPDQIKNTFDIFVKNDVAIKADFRLLTKGRKSQPIPEGVLVINSKDVFIERGAMLLFSHLNASKGPIYIGKDSLIMEGSSIRGPFGMGTGSVVKMGTKIYGATSLGPGCTVGGEIKNSLFYGNSNKGHEGYIGDSVIGEYCNLGADTNNSNLKNNYSEVRLWNYEEERFSKTGLQFCGLVMADHAKCAINTMFNTGTVVGVSANIFGGSFPRNFVPSFSWGGSSGYRTYQLNQALETAKLVMERKGDFLDHREAFILQQIFEQTDKYRNFE
jgi:UDP-N-acetylglucosamine diphosphorylase/glucosamine-1-phosphate N-acetyltransferase